ncbi:MAG: hypothetical protein AB8B79_17970 [Granulosicoccus sp.]
MNSVAFDFVGPPRPIELSDDAKETMHNCIDSAIESSLENSAESSGSFLSNTLENIQKASSIAGMLRMFGAGLLVFSLSLFLIQGIDTTTDLQRYFLLLGQTSLLTLAGFAVGYLLKEPRGARVFFGLGLISIPANFAVLGAMIYSIVPLDSIVTSYPDYASWQSSSVAELFTAGIAGTVVLVPMSIFCFAVLARNEKSWLSIAYLLSSASLLVPMRDMFSMTILSSVTVIGIIIMLSRYRDTKSNLSTSERRFAHALLFAPPLLILARSTMLYSVDFHFTLALIISCYYLLRCAVIRQTVGSPWIMALQFGTLTTVVVLASMMTSLLGAYLAIFNSTLVYGLILAALLVELSRHITNVRMLSYMQGVWSLTIVASLFLDYVFWNGPASIVTSLIIATVIIASGVLFRHLFSTLIGILAFAGHLFLNGSELVAALLSSGWLGMAIAGASTIVLGSVIERYWPVVQLRFIKDKVSSASMDCELAEATYESNDGYQPFAQASHQSKAKAA